MQKNVQRIGTVQSDYYGFSKHTVYGGHKRVYQVVLQGEIKREIAVKQEVTDTNDEVIPRYVTTLVVY